MHAVLFALHAGPLLKRGSTRPVGGMETRAWTFARALAADTNCECSFVVQSPWPLPRQRRQDGVRICPVAAPLWSLRKQVSERITRTPGFPGFQITAPHPALLWQIPLLATARSVRHIWKRIRGGPPRFAALPGDVFVTFGVNSTSAEVMAAAAQTGRPSVLCVAWDGDLSTDYLDHPERRNAYGDTGSVCRDVLQSATAIVVQTEWQQRALQERFHRSSTLIANPIDCSLWQRPSPPQSAKPDLPGADPYCLWAGRADTHHKFPERVFEIARDCPQVPFLMLLSGGDAAVSARLRRSAPPNVRIRGTVPFEEMPDVLRQAFAVINTSDQEGLPNLFLQAMASGVPILSLYAGEQLLTGSRGGLVAHGDRRQLARWIQAAQNGLLDAIDADAARDYVAQHHDISRQAQRLFNVLKETVDCHRAESAGEQATRPG